MPRSPGRRGERRQTAPNEWSDTPDQGSADFGRPLAHLWLPFGSPWLSFGSLWLPSGSLWLPFGSLCLHFGSLLVPFGSPLLTRGSIFSLLLYPGLLFGIFLNSCPNIKQNHIFKQFSLKIRLSVNQIVFSRRAPNAPQQKVHLLL